MSTTQTGKFKVGEAYGATINKEFEFAFTVYNELGEATEAGWTPEKVLELINSQEKMNARANEYQKATAPYRPDPNDPAVIRERMIKDFQKLGVSEAVARAQVESLLAAKV